MNERYKLHWNIMEYIKRKPRFRGEDGYGRNHVGRFLSDCGRKSR